jgi:hypothetical protein
VTGRNYLSFRKLCSHRLYLHVVDITSRSTITSHSLTAFTCSLESFYLACEEGE